MYKRRNYLVNFCLFFVFIIGNAQVSPELLQKAKAAGYTDAQIQEEVQKAQMQALSNNPSQIYGNSLPGITNRPQSVDKQASLEDYLFSIEMQRLANQQDLDLSKIVFGREIFLNNFLSFEPDLNIPTPKGYRLAAGDELVINVWGDSELNIQRTISPDGTILIPNLGPISLSGLSIEAAESRIRTELGRIMSTIGNEEGANTFVSVGLGKIRSLKVNIVGEVTIPGTYTLPAFATLFNALYAAGGINEIGSLRSIKVFRNSKQVADLDVYDYLLNGNYNADIRLENNDMIMVGPYEELITISGKVKRNRIFELRNGETLEQLLRMAGGFTGDAYTSEVTINRKTGERYRLATVMQNDYHSFTMHDQDSVSVGAVIPYYENRLVISGAIWRPGEYELTPEVNTVRKLIEKAKGLKGDEFAGRAHITRLNKDFTTTLLALDIKAILNGSAPDVSLQEEDKLHIPSLFDLRENYTVKVSGAVNTPRTLPYRENMTIEDVIVMSGGLREAAATVNVEVARRIKNPSAYSSSSRTAEQYQLTLTDDLRIVSGESAFILEPFDEVYVRFSPEYSAQQVVKVNGEVTFVGDYALAEKNSRLSDIVLKAGGVTPDAYIKGASLKRKFSPDELRRLETLMDLNANQGGRDSLSLSTINIQEYAVGIDLQKALSYPGSADDLVLRDGDELYIPQMQNTVKLTGAVNYPNSVTYSKNMSVREALAQGGGYNDIARKYPIVVYMNGKVATTKKRLFFKHYPKVEPGCEIIVPIKTQTRDKMSMVEVLSIASSTTSIAAMATSIINTLSKDNNK